MTSIKKYSDSVWNEKLWGQIGEELKYLDPKSFLDAYDRGAGRYEAGGRGDMREDLGGPNSSGPRGSLGGNPRGRWGPADRRGADDYPPKRRRY